MPNGTGVSKSHGRCSDALRGHALTVFALPRRSIISATLVLKLWGHAPSLAIHFDLDLVHPGHVLVDTLQPARRVGESATVFNKTSAQFKTRAERVLYEERWR